VVVVVVIAVVVVGGGAVVVVVVVRVVVRGGGVVRVVVRGRGLLVGGAVTVVAAAVWAGGAGCGGGWPDVVTSQGGTGNGTLLVSGLGVLSVLCCNACSPAKVPNSATAAVTAAATPTARRAMLLCTEAAPFLPDRATMGTLCNRADAIRCLFQVCGESR
jgi:hypothetical protein